MTEPTGALRDYCELLFVGWTTSDALLVSDESRRKTAQDVAWQGHDERARWVAQICQQAAIDGLPVWSDADHDITDAGLYSIGTIRIVGAVELLRPDGTRYPGELFWYRRRVELNALIEADWLGALQTARARVGARRIHGRFDDQGCHPR
jgi:hypothetical protein